MQHREIGPPIKVLHIPFLTTHLFYKVATMLKCDQLIIMYIRYQSRSVKCLWLLEETNYINRPNKDLGNIQQKC
ncbi:hypothetical protein GBAR_LOCUS28993 [Geodia barretti]|uniref:Uncharacterized protein n=1 Tax=Geodia barretti TaxID=519541 RepID=A0AA35TR94_GEOBA|nr:hypothetical protein GBAR_LOCUS28993 [Geodia barretti]